jgi:hypothetical protein
MNQVSGAPEAYINGERITPTLELQGQTFDVVRDGYDRSAKWTYESADADTAFLVGRGWSASPLRWKSIADSGVTTMAVNDYPQGVRPRYWCTGDPPHYFDRRIWLDPQVMKFCPFEYSHMYLPRSSAYGPDNQLTPRQCPNIHYFHKSCNDDPWEFLQTPWLSWGTLSMGEGTPYMDERGDVRSSMLIGIRLLFHLGIRNVYLLGCDFTPTDHPNPEYYGILSTQLKTLRGVFERYGLRVLNANEDSHLRVFDIVPFEDALKEAA